MVSKAFACTYADECDCVISATNMLTKKADRTTQAINKMRVVQELRRNPQRSKELYSLYAGTLSRDLSIPDGNQASNTGVTQLAIG